MSAKRKQADSLPRLSTNFLGNFAIDWVPENESQPRQAILRDRVWTGLDDDDDDDEISQESQWPVSTPEELKETIKNWVRQKLGRLDRGSEDSQESYNPSSAAAEKVEQAAQRKRYVLLLAIALDPLCTFPSAVDDAREPETFKEYLESKMTSFLRHVQDIIDTWCA
ncbi:hypothetical protein QBC46DRAFT_404623 [Diplogelasinospora grovesii]|uniref:Uncharacterized protein n=1 Tax=Diplogelasinospora grovesii TaxID=303347 RepID=A0AAN6NEL1_9PEZI|nr:hypothetical protein QBC46DRAFT_404623 [Diplogelasinospora grovesii]